MGVIGTAILMGILLWALTAALRTTRRTMRDSGRDRAQFLVALASRRLAAEWGDWGPAMLAELDHIAGPAARWQFALGCLWVALLPPARPDRSGWTLLTIIVAGAVACASVVAYGATQAAPMNLRLTSGTGTILGAVLAAYVGVAAAQSRSASDQGVAARRYGLAAGAVSGGLWLIGSTPAGAIWPGEWAAHYLPAGLSVICVAAVMAGRAAPRASIRAGAGVGLWSGLVASLILCSGLLIVTYSAIGWLVHDPATIASLQRSNAPDQAQEIVSSLVSSNAEVLIFLVHGPLISVAAGALGGMVGALLLRSGSVLRVA